MRLSSGEKDGPATRTTAMNWSMVYWRGARRGGGAAETAEANSKARPAFARRMVTRRMRGRLHPSGSLDTALPLAYLPQTMADLSITLPDGSQKQVPAGTTVGDFVKQHIGAGLARAALFAKLDDEELDLSRPLTRRGKLTVFTNKSRGRLDLIRHDAAHIIANLVQRLVSRNPGTHRPLTQQRLY